MFEFEYNKDITSLTTFGIRARAAVYAEYSSKEELLKISRSDEFINNEVLHIGGGSNLLFIGDFKGLALHSAICDIRRYDKNPDTTYVIAGAGVKWTDLVEFCLSENLAGLENLADIPGEVGASAVQNVGAYGVEAKDVIHKVECFDTETRKVVEFTNEECHFAYRDSIFKNEWKGRYIVLRVAYRVVADGEPRSLDYGPLKDLTAKLGRTPTIREVAQEVSRIRASKLPDPKELGSAGSFFKNPEVRKRFHQELEEMSGCKIPYHELPDREDGVAMVKLNAAWLIDHAGLKGMRVGGASVYRKQPLVIVNDGNASGEDVRHLANIVEREVRRRFFIRLSPEVNYIDSRLDVTVLGSGTSKGVPEIGCLCPACTSGDPHDKRTRASVLVEHMGVRLLIDASPDFRQQAIRENIGEIDAVLITHDHYDHVGGIDDLRPYCMQRNVPMYVREDVDSDLHKRLDYCFSNNRYPGVPTFDMHIIDDKPFYIKGIKITPINVMHGKLPIFGYRIGNFAYITDAKTIPESEMWKLEGVDTLIVNALRFLHPAPPRNCPEELRLDRNAERSHFAHFSVEEAIDFIKEVNPKVAYLTHFCHEIGTHALIDRRLPDNVHPAYDGMHITVG